MSSDNDTPAILPTPDILFPSSAGFQPPAAPATGTALTTPPPASDPKREALSEIDRRLFGDLPASSAMEMFPTETALRPVLSAREDDLGMKLGWSRADQVAHHNGVAAMVRDAQIDPSSPTVRLIYNTYVDALVSSLTPPTKDADPERELTLRVQADLEATRRTLAAQFGVVEAENLLRQKDEWLATQPKLAEVLKVDAIGARPEIAVALVDVVRRKRFEQ